MDTTLVNLATEQKPKVAWYIDEYRPGDKDDILWVNSLQYPESDLPRPEFFDWLYQDNPHGQATIVVARNCSTNRVIGFIWGLPVRLSYFEEMRTAHLVVNILVHPEFRSLNILKALINKGLEIGLKAGINILVGFPNPRSKIIIQRLLGYTDTVQMPLLVKPLNFTELMKSELAQRKISNPILRRAIGLGDVVRPFIFHSRRPGGEGRQLQVRLVNDFDSQFDVFWQRVRSKYPIMIARDSQYLRWRYRRLPIRDYYIFVVQAEDKLVGYCITRAATLRGIKTGLVMDLLVEPGPRGEAAGLLLLKAAEQAFTEQGMHMLGAMFLPHTHEYQILSRAGYWNCPEKLAPQPFTAITRIHGNHNLPEDKWPFIRSCFLSMGDHDAV